MNVERAALTAYLLAALGVAVMTLSPKSRLREAVERALPWYDPTVERQRHSELRAEIAASVAARTRAVRAIHRAERVRAPYAQSADHFRR